MSEGLGPSHRNERTAMRDDYYLMEPPPAEPVEACPCCGSSARVWVYAEDPTMPVTRVVMCDHSGSIGPRDALVYEGCLLQMPPDDFYRETGREAVQLFRRLADEQHAAIVMVTHDNKILDVADRIVNLEEGRLV